MTTYRAVVEFEIDDDALAGWDGTRQAPPSDVDDWYHSDLVAAVNSGLAELPRQRLVGLERRS